MKTVAVGLRLVVAPGALSPAGGALTMAAPAAQDHG